MRYRTIIFCALQIALLQALCCCVHLAGPPVRCSFAALNAGKAEIEGEARLVRGQRTPMCTANAVYQKALIFPPLGGGT
jgi:hypothetical protein